MSQIHDNIISSYQVDFENELLMTKSRMNPKVDEYSSKAKK